MPAPLLPEERVTVEMDMDSKHTPGPWVDGPIGLEGANGKSIDVANLRCAWVSAYENPEAVANGLLMKAAPDLLSALPRIMTCLELVLSGKPCRDVPEAMGEARAAIAKAEGR